MAAGHALATARVGVACVTAGPGLANAVPGINEAQAAGIPVVVIAGRTGLGLRGRGAVQDLEQLSLVAPITKWRQSCWEAGRVGEYVAAAFHHAAAGSPGVAYLEIPEDILGREAGDEPASRVGFSVPARTEPEPGAVEAALGLLGSAQRPVALAGSGAFFSRAGRALQAFTETTGIPVVTTSAGRGVISDDHPHCAGSLVHGGAAMLSADVSLLLGSRFNANLLYGRSPLFAPDSRVIQVDVNPSHLGGQRRPELGLSGDVSATLEALTGRWSGDPDALESWRDDAIGAARASREQWSSEADHPVDGIHPGWLARATADFAARQDAPFVVDGGDSVIWGLAFGKARGPGRHIFLGSAMGTLGVGLPYALATALAANEPSILYTGDGAFGLSAMEIDTVGRSGMGVLAVVVNNGGWGGGERHFRYHLLADAAGGQGIRVEAADGVAEALEEGWSIARSGRPAIVDVVTARAVHSEFMGAMDSLSVM